MFRDFKKGGLNQEGTQVKGERLIAIILLITLAYSQSLIPGKIISQKGVVNNVNRITGKGRKYRRHSHFYTGNRGQSWLNSLEMFSEEAEELMANCSQEGLNYHQRYKSCTPYYVSLLVLPATPLGYSLLPVTFYKNQIYGLNAK